jgi:hypothetical protein
MKPCLAVVTAAMLLGSGCARMVYQPILTDADNARDRGIRYYEQSPYLIAYSNGQGGVVAEIRYLPDPTRLMSVRPEATLADVGTTLVFSNGVLTSSKDTGDGTAVTKAVLTAVKTLGTALIAANEPEGAASRPAVGEVPAPQIYRIVVKSHSVELIGGSAGAGFSVTLLPQDPPKKEKL